MLKKTSTPKASAVLKVINNFKSVLHLATREDHLDMFQGDVNEYYQCGTVHCHGGWYAIATCNLRQALTFQDGARQLAHDLGFENAVYMKQWASTNEKLWGNDEGGNMFTTRWAFYNTDKRANGAKNLQHIIDHWREVYNRIKRQERSKKVANK